MSGNKTGLAAFLKKELNKPTEPPPVVTPENPPSVQPPQNEPVIVQEKPIFQEKPVKRLKSVSNKVTESVTPYYLTLSRKEVRLRDDQYDELTHLARGLNRNKAAGSERITENTLIRIAIDLLLAKSSHLSGSTEEQLLASVKQKLTEKN